jgi:hypothetical protein
MSINDNCDQYMFLLKNFFVKVHELLLRRIFSIGKARAE